MNPVTPDAEVVIDAAGLNLLETLVDSLRRNAPKRSKCVFLNCEMHIPNEGAFTVSGDLFAVSKPVLRAPRRVQRALTVHEVQLLDTFGSDLMRARERQHAILDVIVSDAGYKHFISFGPLRRIRGNDDFFKSKHKSYVHLEPWLGQIA